MPEPRTILVTFCNVTSGAPALGLFDADRATIEVLRTPEALSEQGGVTGVALNDEFLFLATSRMSGPRQATVPAGPSGIFTLDRRDLSLRAVHTCATVFDAHSLWLDGDSLLVVSTGTDAVVRLSLDGPRVVSEENVWRPEQGGPPTDVHHLNAIYDWRGRRLVAGFGVKSGTQWSSATDGFIVNIASGERLVSGVRQPHSMVAAGDALAYCESANGTVRLVGRSDERTLPGFTRGLCTAGDGLFAATSRGRRVSKSTGALTSRSEPGTLSGGCAIVELETSSLAVRSVTDLDAYGWEVYDLLAVAGTSDWPVVGPAEWRDAVVAGLRRGDDDRQAALAWLHGEVASRDEEIKWLHGEVATRDRTIEWLHREVADRDRLIEFLRTCPGGEES